MPVSLRHYGMPAPLFAARNYLLFAPWRACHAVIALSARHDTPQARRASYAAAFHATPLMRVAPPFTPAHAS